MRIWFWDVSIRDFVHVDPVVLVPFYSEIQDLAELSSERRAANQSRCLVATSSATCVSNST